MTIQPITDDQKVAYRSVLANLKAAIKADAELIRLAKQVIRSDAKQGLSTSTMQFTLHKDRVRARARLIVYGLCRGRSWERMEPNHPEGDPSLKSVITQVWRSALGEETGSFTSMPANELLAPWILR